MASATPTWDASLGFDIQVTDIPESAWIRHFMSAESGRVSRAFRWDTKEAGFDLLLETEPLLAQTNLMGGGSAILRVRGTLVYVHLQPDSVFVRVIGDEATTANVVKEIQAMYPVLARRREEPRIRFWMHGGPHSPPASTGKTVTAPAWETSQENYPARTRAQLEKLMSWDEPPPSGSLLLWYGEPGTGKTWAIQTLAGQWYQWADFHCISDPEAFFADARYMMHVMLFDREKRDRWRVMVLEDTGELLSADAKMRTGQGLSRLLNLTDGLIGRGSKTLILLTSNEELSFFHPAVARSGRCAARIGFDLFSAADSARWLESHGAPAQALGSGDHCLADLYAALRGELDSTERRTFGFAPAAANGSSPV